MKWKSSASVLIIVSLVSVLVGQIVSLVMANPGLWLLGFPSEPVKTPPEIVFQSPLNDQTYDSNPIWLNFTIVKPESWFFVANSTYIKPNNYIYVNITSVSYSIDSITSKNIPILDVTDLLVENTPSRTLNFSTTLSLPKGAHNLTINLQCTSYYWGDHYSIPSNITLNFSSETVCFTVLGSVPEFPSWTILPLVLTITLFSIIVRKQLHKAKVS
jgi:hypothetical protein